jgi:uncharacterized protein YdhG (YjbR/CyaY superfamily)
MMTPDDQPGHVHSPTHQGAVCGIRVRSEYPLRSVEDSFGTSWLLSACPRAGPYDGIVRSDAVDVDSYLMQVPEGRRAVLTGMRDACRRLLAGFAESMSYGMPAYSRDGTAEVAWASQKRYISLYVMRADVLDAHRGQLAGLDVGKGCIRYRSPAAVDFTVVHSILAAVVASRGPVC